MARDAGRDVRKEEVWRRRLGAQAGSGVSVRAWCRQHEVRESAFYWWRARLARRAGQTPAFMPVRVVADAAEEAAGRIEIVLPGAWRVLVTGHVERGTLADILAVLTDGARAGAPRC